MSDRFQEGIAGLEAGPEASSAASASATGWDAGLPPNPSVNALRERFGSAILRNEVQGGDEHVVFVAPERSFEILRWLHDDPEQGYDLCLDVTCVDYGGGRPIQVVYQLCSIPHRRLLRVKAELPLRALEIASVVPIWNSANWLEREAYDLFGVQFTGHPDLRRILMPENYEEGHPLRKDFPLRGRFSRAEQTRRALAMDVEDFYIPAELEVGGTPVPPVEETLSEGKVLASGAPEPSYPATGEQRQGDARVGSPPPAGPAPGSEGAQS